MGRNLIKVFIIIVVFIFCVCAIDIFSEGQINIKDWKYFVGKIDYDIVIEYTGSDLREDDKNTTYMLDVSQNIIYKKTIELGGKIPVLKKYPRVVTRVYKITDEEISYIKGILSDTSFDEILESTLSNFHIYDKYTKEEAYLYSSESQLGEFSKLWDILNKE